MLHRCLPLQLRRAILGGILATLTSSAVIAQNQAHWLSLSYYKTLPGKAADFRKFAETDMLKMGQMGIDEGVLDSYTVLRLTTPYATSSDYDYSIGVWYKNRPSLEPQDMKAWQARAEKAGYKTFQQYLDRRDSMAKQVRMSWRTIIARVGDMHTGNYIRTAMYKVEPEFRQDLARFLREYSVPIAQAQFSDGRAVGYTITRPAAAIMSDEEAGFSFSVTNVLKDGDTLLTGPPALTEAIFKKAVPGTPFTTYMSTADRINAHRKIVSTRIHEVVVMAGSPPTVKP